MAGDEPLPEDIAEETEEYSPPRTGIVAGVATLMVLIFVAAIYTGVAQTAAGLVVFPGIPIVLLWFVWRLFLRRLWRIRKIRNAREKRELLEAARRKFSGKDPG